MGVKRTKSNDIVWINVTSVPLFKNGDKEPSQVFTTFDDITPRVEIEKALRVSEIARNSAIEDSRIKS